LTPQFKLDFAENIEKVRAFQNILKQFIPHKSLALISTYLAEKNVKLKIVRSRRTKLGDFRVSLKTKATAITVNQDLNEYSFLITLVHEIAHLDCYLNHKKRVKPHGDEWKNEFKKLMQPFFYHKIFPQDIFVALNNYMNNPLASSCSDLGLMRVLKNYDKQKNNIIYLEEVAENTIFRIGKNRVFKKGIKRRKLYKCMDLNSKKHYLINPLSEIEIVE